MRITSTAFAEGESIPAKYTCDGEDTSPPFNFADVPPEAQSLALLVEDPDAPRGVFMHWAIWGITPETSEVPEGSAPSGAKELKNDFGNKGYGGPCPPSGTHRYYFRLFALDAADLPAPAQAKELRAAITDHVLAEATLMGRYSRSQ